jgi:deoxyribodipyrimidine photo-lyase
MKIAVILRNDLRLHDHPAMHQASLDGDILPVYVLEENLGSAFKYWTHGHLKSLQSSLRKIDGELYVSSHSLKETIESLRDELRIDAVYFNRSYYPNHRIRDEALAHKLDEKGILVKTFEGTIP